jgi:hypothetical protein
MDLRDDLRLTQHEQIVVALHELGKVSEPRAAIAGLVQLVPLDHGAHGAVDEQDALGGCLLQSGDALVAGHALSASFAGVAPASEPGRSPSRWQMA